MGIVCLRTRIHPNKKDITSRQYRPKIRVNKAVIEKMSVIWGVGKVERKLTKEKRLEKERIILGLDPGTNIMGYGVILVRGQAMSILQFGVIQLSKYANHELKLKKIF